MSKLRVDMDAELFRDLLVLCMENPEDPTLARLGKVLEDKLNRAVAREFYTKSKTASSPEEREQARQAYLNHKGIAPEHRW